MEALPNWLADAVHAAGMTAYADDLYPKVAKDMSVDAPVILEEPPLH
ncbi:MAG: hypothetical protein ABI789_05865 [Usitatibacter sp.]